jgi:virulence-associated protein VapD
MSKIDKLKIRLLSFPKDFSYNELKTLLASFGYKEIQGAGSRVYFSKDNHKIKLHKPHSGNILKAYQLDFVIKELISKDLIIK